MRRGDGKPRVDAVVKQGHTDANTSRGGRTQTDNPNTHGRPTRLEDPAAYFITSMSKNASDKLVEGLLAWNVDTVFGIPGDGINGVMEALRQNQEKIRFIQTRHEESAAFIACAYAKYTGRLG